MTCGFAAEISAMVASTAFESLKAPILRVALPDTPAPMSAALERAYYPTATNIVSAVKKLLEWSPSSSQRVALTDHSGPQHLS